MNPTRRSFHRTSAATGAALGVAPHRLFSSDGIPPSEPVPVGLIGCGGEGRLLWDAGQQRICNREAANRYLIPEYCRLRIRPEV